MSNICLSEMMMTKTRLEEQKKEIDKKIEAINTVLEMFENSEQVKSIGKEPRVKKQRAARGALTPEEKKKRKKASMDRWLAKKKLKLKEESPNKKVDYDNMA